MAPLPVIPNVFRIDVPWPLVNGVSFHNTFHIETAASNMLQIGEALGDNFTSASGNPWHYIPSGASTTNIEITPLDGITPKQTVPLGATWSGSSTGALMPAVCGLVSFRTGRRGPQGRGRLYIGPMGENSQENGLVTGADREDVELAWNDILGKLNVATPSIEIVVASYTHAEAYPVTSINAPSACATQRRRQSRLS